MFCLCKVYGQTEAVEKVIVTIKPFAIYYFIMSLMKEDCIPSLMKGPRSLNQLRWQVLKGPLEVSYPKLILFPILCFSSRESDSDRSQ